MRKGGILLILLIVAIVILGFINILVTEAVDIGETTLANALITVQNTDKHK